jgi:hypothetical protein
MSLGIEHRIEKVDGIRWSFTKQIYAQEVQNWELPENLIDGKKYVAGYGPDHGKKPDGGKPKP